MRGVTPWQIATAWLTLMRQQPFLALDTAADTGQRAICADHSGTGNDDGNGIAAIRQTHRTRAIGVPQAFGELAIAPGFSERDLQKFVPHTLLNLGALHLER